ncbi:MAG: SPFH domain-containing protein [Acidimicrobiaceae bacterium]|nr:SPFH domain-containing protein [Acidimicrobiaceae bacterium]MDE0656245.1 SPFH domain-containing protein [Acidimicrobiaceae bacterium]MXZ96109.1 SPFH domain-containing protein [Acidimicrobiaceae bacterium]MYF43600.1 SPFH domain-containing protein [Acidimicrobiaceae bacterium]MYJ35400.1 SPFH domain-containing protein [Acidimicrobiaceae bacterium]
MTETSSPSSSGNLAEDSSTPAVTARPAGTKPGLLGVLIALLGLVVIAAGIVGVAAVAWPLVFLIPVGGITFAFAWPGQYLVQPNEALVLILFGRYKGTVETPGWHLANPFTRMESRKISLRVHNFTTSVSKVNDAEGNPIEISAVVVWRVVDTAAAVFEVDDFEDFVHVQSETAIRHLGTQYPYDDFEGDRVSLRSDPDTVAATLHAEVQDRLDRAGVEVIETRLNHLAYATEIAEAMLRRQQAAAVVAARRTIVEGAVGMVEEALELLAERSVVDLDEQAKASMVANLLVVLTSEQQTTPIVNTGSLP